MTQYDKKLLLKDLSARLPYDVKVHIIDDDDCIMVCKLDNETINFVGSWDIKPYLRPMFSMTEEEKKTVKSYIALFQKGVGFYDEGATFLTDFYNEHHLDYRGLIEKGLALEAPEGMYKID